MSRPEHAQRNVYRKAAQILAGIRDRDQSAYKAALGSGVRYKAAQKMLSFAVEHGLVVEVGRTSKRAAIYGWADVNSGPLLDIIQRVEHGSAFGLGDDVIAICRAAMNRKNGSRPVVIMFPRLSLPAGFSRSIGGRRVWRP